MKTLTTILLALLSHAELFSQRTCGTEQYIQKVLQKNPLISLKMNGASGMQSMQLNPNADYSKREYASILNNSPLEETPVIIPVVVHVVYNKGAQNISEDQINSQIEALNLNFNKENRDVSTIPAAFKQYAAATNIRFALAKVDPDGRATNGITRKKSSCEQWTDDDKIKDEAFGGVKAWDSRYYLNIWVCNLLGDLLGYSSFPGTPADNDGVVIRLDVFGTRGIAGSGSFNMGRTAVHEVGHWLNLKHLWGDVHCGTDDVDDTPPQRTYNRGCPVYPRLNKDCAAANPNGEMFMNFMDFSDDVCMKMFTDGQRQRMMQNFQPGGLRYPILLSKALGEPYNFSPPVPASGITLPTLKVYPNPVGEVLHFQVARDVILAGKHFAIVGADGRTVSMGVFSREQNSLSVASLRPGIYFIRIIEDPAMPKISFIKQ